MQPDTELGFFYAVCWIIAALASLSRLYRDGFSGGRIRLVSDAVCGGFLSIGVLGSIMANSSGPCNWNLGIAVSVFAGLFPWALVAIWKKLMSVKFGVQTSDLDKPQDQK